jgi:preprotein translocase subunit SecD
MSDYFDRVERQIVQRVQDGAPQAGRRPNVLGYLATAAAVLVVIVVAGAFLLARGSSPTPTKPSAPAAGQTVSVTFRASAIDGHAPLGPAIERSITILLERLDTAFPGTLVERSGNDVVVVARSTDAGTRPQMLRRILSLTTPGRLEFYDWEADALTPTGKTVGSQLEAQNPTALEISQGSGSGAPGEPGAGALSHAQATALVSRYPGSVIVQAVARTGAYGVGSTGPSLRFYVLRNVPALSGQDIMHPKATTDPNAGGPDVTFGFTPNGAVAFKALTKRVAERGQRLSSPGQTFNQHFAITLDDRLISVPYIDFKVYPDGITTQNGANISGSFTTESAKDLATILRYGPLPVALTATG